MAQMSGNIKKYNLKCDWGYNDWTYSCGGDGLVIGRERCRTTAFFEIYPSNPKCFLRGEGSSIEDAETDAFNTWKNILSCKKHEWERRGRKDGYAYCKHCNLSGIYLQPVTKCCICGVSVSHRTDKSDKMYCEKHGNNIPHKLRKDERFFSLQKRMPKKLKKALKKAFINSLISGEIIGCGVTKKVRYKKSLCHIVKGYGYQYAPIGGMRKIKLYINKHSHIIKP